MANPELQAWRAAIRAADAQWAGKPRHCPNCGTAFTSRFNRGQCVQCGKVFYAANPSVGDDWTRQLADFPLPPDRKRSRKRDETANLAPPPAPEEPPARAKKPRKSVFQAFIKALTAEWKARLPWVRKADRTYNIAMPKSSTFDAGVLPDCGKRVFLNFQHSRKSWEVGNFTINVIVTSNAEAFPDNRWGPDELRSRAEGSYRIGSLLHNVDKWWYLKFHVKDRGHWRADSYRDQLQVIKEAIADVTADVVALFTMMGLDVTP